jgi:hypothetical protein
MFKVHNGQAYGLVSCRHGWRGAWWLALFGKSHAGNNQGARGKTSRHVAIIARWRRGAKWGRESN